MASATENSSDVPKDSDEPKPNGPERAGSPIATEKVSFDDRGDLTLRVGSLEDGSADVFDFVVCSRALARASPVFRAMLFSGFSESKPEGDTWIVKLPEDRPAPFFILLNIIHGCFSAVPQKLELDELYQLLVVTNKYDMLSVIFQWAPIWFEPHKNLDAISEGNERLLWIAWELGEERTFEVKCRDFVLGSKVNPEGQIVDKIGVPLNTYDCYEARGIIDDITKARQDILNKLSSDFHAAIREGLKGRECKKERPKEQPESHYAGYHGYGHPPTKTPALSATDWTAIKDRCNDTALVEVMKAVERLGLGKFGVPQETRTRFLGNVNAIWYLIFSLRSKSQAVHKICSPLNQIMDRFEGLMGDFKSPISDNNLKYMRNQAKKTAIGGDRSEETEEPQKKRPRF
ncbi:hypothetical protein CPAR01_09398 [Colletotrichum paranaense]|uniref:Nuclear pore protein n=1 Tax=Colletotrichum paranaense TaxID=1914294 RepID=A0ABQ9SGL7_9PEZI|nr:uncharacterized protein CPAR01_09398 [Colletotrichum paranaense]KAK1535856.1 hypothetical protein CPAR01_09398 [Colletotrichum paranaense]